MARTPRTREALSAAERTKRLLATQTPQAVQVLVTLMLDEGQKPELRMKAAESILDRVCGKAGSTGVSGGEGGSATVRFEGVLEEWSQ